MNGFSLVRLIIFIIISIAIFVLIDRVKRNKKPQSTQKDETKNTLKMLLIFGCFFGIIGFIAVKYSEKQEAEILSHKGLALATVVGYSPHGAKTSDQFEYTFTISGMIFKGDHIGIWPNSNYKDFIGRQFVVIYDTLNPNNESMLISPRDFKRYNIPFPDSLKWVIPYYDY